MKQRILFLSAIGLLVLGLGIALIFRKPGSSRQITFEECAQAGGTAWRVDLYHPDICSACSEYRACRQENQGAPDLSSACPAAADCAQCMEANFPYPDRCPEDKEKIGEISDAAIWFQCCK